jgi:hypothetical protein
MKNSIFLLTRREECEKSMFVCGAGRRCQTLHQTSPRLHIDQHFYELLKHFFNIEFQKIFLFQFLCGYLWIYL